MPKRPILLTSLVLHVIGLLGLLLFSVISPPRISLPPKSTVDIQFAQPAQPEKPKPEESKADVSRETPRPTPRKTPKPKASPKKPDPTPRPTPKTTPKTTPKPKKTPEPRKPEPTPKPEKTRPPEPKATPPPAPTRTYYPPTPVPEAASSASNASSANATSVSNPPSGKLRPSGSQDGNALGVVGNLTLPSYYTRLVINKIAENFKVPEDRRADRLCRIGFHILADGRISAPKIVESSGDLGLDALALRALKETREVAPLPDELRSRVRAIEAVLTFSFAE